MKKLIREFFFLRKGERRSLYFVLCILTISLVIRILYSSRPLPEFVPDEVFISHMESIRRQVDSALQQERKQKKHTSWSGYTVTGYKDSSGNIGSAWSGRRYGYNNRGDSGASGSSERPKEIVGAAFDPNTVSYEALLSMNLSAYVSRNIISYREAGGSFREPSDLAKIYGLMQEDFRILEPYIEIRSAEVPAAGPEPGSDTVKSPFPGSRWTDTLTPLELNRVDSAELLVLPGIGPWFAGRIIQYRELLGGYVDPGQIREVYGMDSARYDRISSFLTADSSLIDHIDLNTSTFQEVISHPYISREETYAIFRYREYMDKIPGPEILLEDQIIDRERFMRMAPYLSVSGLSD